MPGRELVLSEVKDWQHEDVLQALIGLSFASIDALLLPDKHIPETLCPPEDRDVDWPAKKHDDPVDALQPNPDFRAEPGLVPGGFNEGSFEVENYQAPVESGIPGKVARKKPAQKAKPKIQRRKAGETNPSTEVSQEQSAPTETRGTASQQPAAGPSELAPQPEQIPSPPALRRSSRKRTPKDKDS